MYVYICRYMDIETGMYMLGMYTFIYRYIHGCAYMHTYDTCVGTPNRVFWVSLFVGMIGVGIIAVGIFAVGIIDVGIIAVGIIAVGIIAVGMIAWATWRGLPGASQI